MLYDRHFMFLNAGHCLDHLLMLLFPTAVLVMGVEFGADYGELLTLTAAVGFYATLIFALAALAQIVVGHLIDRYPLRTVLMGLVALQIPFFLFAAGTGEGWLLLAVLGLMLLVFGEIPIHDAIVARYAAAGWRSRIYAVKYLLGLGVSATAIPLVATTQASAGGFTLLLWLLAGMATLILVAAALLPRPAAKSAADSIPSAAVNR